MSGTAAPFALKIRRATASDAEGICEIYNQAISERIATFETELRTVPTMRDSILERDERHPVLVAVGVREGECEVREGRAIVGWACISIYSPRSCYSGIGEFSIYVKKDARRQRVGVRLTTALVEEAKRFGYWKLVSRVFPSNFASRNLCRSCGFREVGIYEKHAKLDGRWIDAIIVERVIQENLV